MNKILIILLYSMISLVAYAGEEENKALENWESVQKSYKQNQLFEKISDGKYKIRNDGIGYDGELLVKNIIIEDEDSYGRKEALIVVKLTSKPEDMYSLYGESYSNWQDTNTLYYDKSKSQWVRYRDLTRENYGNCNKSDDYKKIKGIIYSAATPLIVFIFIYIFLRVVQRKQVGYMERGRMHMERVESTLEKILEAVKKDA